MDPFLTAASQRKPCLSCGDISALASNEEYNQLCHKWRRKYSATTIFASIRPPRFLRQKSPPVQSMDRNKSRSSDGLVDNIDCRLAEIKKNLASFREQDIELRKRMYSLNNSIEDLVSSQSHYSLASEDSNTSESEPPVFGDDEAHDKDDQSIENKIKTYSESFSSDVLNCIPTIAITYHMTRQASDPGLSENDREST